MICRNLFRRLLNSSRVNSRAIVIMETVKIDKKCYLGPQTRSKTKLYSTSCVEEKSKPEQPQNNSSNTGVGEMAYIVGHDKDKKEFYIKLKGDDGSVKKEKAVLQYDWIRPKFADLYHTGVPPAFRGRGIAKLLAQAATEHFAAQEVMMKPSCTYIQKYVLETRIPRIWDLTNWDDID